MKKIIILITAVLLPLFAGAQSQINTKKVKIGDFTEKVTKIVLNGNSIFDTILKEEITARWRISPFEFCTLEEFEGLKGSEQYYFLLTTQGQFKKETAPGILFLTLVKGGKEAEMGIGEMLEVVTFPLSSVEYPSGREFTFLPAIIDIIQDHTLASMENDLNGYGGLGNHSTNIFKSGNMTIVFSEDDLSPMVNEVLISQKFDKDMIICEEDAADGYMDKNAANTLVSYVVAASEPVPGSYCYKMLIDAENHKLYYFRRHRIGKKLGAGFLPKDINSITASRIRHRP